MIKAVVIDDEQKTHNIVGKIIEKEFQDIKIVASAKNVTKGIEIIQKHLPDIVFLDVQMPDGTGFDLLKKINYHNFKLIFITAHEENALQAIKFSAIDFILKPINIIDFTNSVIEVIKEIKQDNEHIKIKTFLNNIENSSEKSRKIVLKTTENIYIVNIKDIIRCESENNYTIFFLNDNRKILISKTLKEYSELLERYNFIRIHRSHLINLNYIERFEKKDSGLVYMKDKSKVPVSFLKKFLLLDSFEKFLNP